MEETAPCVALHTHGCKLNQAESEALALSFAAAGYRVVPPGAAADVYVLNSCSVTHTADARARQWLRRLGRTRPGALVVATGCYAERDAFTLQGIPGVDLVAGNTAKDDLLAMVNDLLERNPAGARTEILGSRSRSLVKIQDGCQSGCAYCVVPLVRPAEYCRPAAAVVREVAARASAGYLEVVLTGTKVGTYHDAGTDLSGLLRRVLRETGIRRLRLSSLQPQEINRELLARWQEPRLCRHFHLSLQSGSDTVLKRMGRRYDSAAYGAAVALIREVVPGASITTDVIAGFPGETDAEFRASHRFCREMVFARIHVFPYSVRPGTTAAEMASPVPPPLLRQRTQSLLGLARRSLAACNRDLIGSVLPVLWEQVKDGVWDGLTDNYVRVFTSSSADIGDTITPVKLVSAWKDGLWGEIENGPS